MREEEGWEGVRRKGGRGKEEEEEQHGGKMEKSMKGESEEGKEHLRHFKLVEVDGKPYKSSSRVNITDNQTPSSAAKKLLTRMIRSQKLSDSAKSKLKVIFYIKETNRESKGKVYGPYVGTYHKYTPSEAAKSHYQIKDGGPLIHHKFKTIVKLYKGNKTTQKGGEKM